VSSREGGLSLTFDDGPDPVWTPVVLQALARLGARATFFVMAPRALQRPDLVAAIREGGHAVELHCWSHVRHSRHSRREIEADADHALRALGTLGVTPTLWRTPWGDTAPRTGEVAAERGLGLAGWTADTHDWRGDTAERMLDAIRHDLADDAVVLMHDGLGPGARRWDCLQTVRLLGPLCDLARARGWALDAAPRPAGSPA
jgi:peptidoglycan/xylan/chitin deacetylase (PgdA/CDA1 family)